MIMDASESSCVMKAGSKNDTLSMYIIDYYYYYIIDFYVDKLV